MIANFNCFVELKILFMTRAQLFTELLLMLAIAIITIIIIVTDTTFGGLMLF